MRQSYIEITEKVYPKLTKGLKKVARLLLDDPIVFAIHPAKKIGELIGVSETTVIRFCKTLGFEFRILQEEIQKDLVHFNQKSGQLFVDDTNSEKAYFEQIDNDLNLIKSNLHKIDQKIIKQATSVILNSEKVIVAGNYQSFTYAYWLYYNLNYVLDHVFLYRAETDSTIINKASENACLVVYSFYRYANDTLHLAKSAKAKGIHVIAITDSSVSPITEYADTTIVINIGDHFSFLRIGPVAITVSNMLLYEIYEHINLENYHFNSYHYLVQDGDKENNT